MSKDNKILKRGFTLIELLIGISVLGILTGIIFTSFVNVKKNESIKKDSELIIGVLQSARNQTLSSQNASQYGVHFDIQEIILFTGINYSASDPSNKAFKVNSNATTISKNLNGGGSDIIFERLSGETNQYGTVTLSSPSQTLLITIYKTGLAE